MKSDVVNNDKNDICIFRYLDLPAQHDEKRVPSSKDVCLTVSLCVYCFPCKYVRLYDNFDKSFECQRNRHQYTRKTYLCVLSLAVVNIAGIVIVSTNGVPYVRSSIYVKGRRTYIVFKVFRKKKEKKNHQYNRSWQGWFAKMRDHWTCLTCLYCIVDAQTIHTCASQHQQ